jgi:Alr-MurF fusion protein
MPQISLHKLADITSGKLYGRGEEIISNLETDSRRITSIADSIFIAIRGVRHDSHHNISELYQLGIHNFLIDDTQFSASDFPGANFIRVENTVPALQSIATYYRKTLKMPIVAITGSNGKTVVKEWLFQCLSYSGTISRSPKSYNSQIGVPLSVWGLNPSARWSLIEAGISLPGEMEKLEKIIAPDMGIITNIGQAHQENFVGFEEKAKEKLKLFNNVSVLFYCSDHTLIHQTICNSDVLSSGKLVAWSKLDPECHLYVLNSESKAGATKLNLRIGSSEYKINIPFSDEASTENCLHIINFLFYNGFTSDYIQNALNHLTAIAMRLEQVKGFGNSTIINDSYNSDLNSLKIALDFLAMQKQHKKHALILSDIKQTGLPPDELYAQVVHYVKSYKIDEFIVVGSEISSYAGLPGETMKFGSTSEFLSNLQPELFFDCALLIKGAREYGFEAIVKALSDKKHSTVLEINLNNLVYNLNYFRGLLKPDTKILVMVKALSYGSGSYEIANLLEHERVDYLGVAFTDEGAALRHAGIKVPIMVMTPTDDTFEDIIELNLEPEIYSLSLLKKFSKAVSASQLPEYPVHLKLDTGMHRLGLMPAELPPLLNMLEEYPNIRVKAIFSHLAVSDNPAEDNFTKLQLRNFNEMYDLISNHLGYKPMRHILNSAGIERFKEAHFEMVRLGIGLHGISSNNADLKAVSRLKTTIEQIKQIPGDETVGYNRHGKLDKDSVIAIIPIGYADGLNRKFGNRNGFVIVNNQRADFVGDICMDMSMIDVTGLHVKEGDEVIIFGEENPIQNLANQIETIPYEILTNVSSRVKRVYINE